jgi:hypothetical protein
MKKHLSKRRVVLAAVVVVALAIASGVAFAYFSSSGNGTGAAGVGTSSSFTVAQVGTISGLIPGAAAQDVTIRVTNPTTYVQSLKALTVSVASASGTCDASWFTPTSPSIAGDTQIAAGGHQDFTGTIKMIESGTNQDSCKGATVNLAFAAS